MYERIFVKSSDGNGGNCVEASLPEEFDFKKSTYCLDGHCLEVGGDSAQVLMRDSKLETSPFIETSPESFTFFIGGVVAQETFARIDA